MDLASLLFLALGQPELTVVAEDEHSRCPDLVETQRLVNERVDGHLESAHELHQQVVTDAQSGQSYVRIRLFNLEHAILLERLIPVENNDCADVPLAIATIAEHYFYDVSVTNAAAPPLPTPEQREESQLEASESLKQSTLSVADTKQQNKSSRTRVYGSVAVGHDGRPFLELGLNQFFVPRGFIDLSMRAQLVRAQHKEEGYQITHMRHSLYLGSGLQLPLHPSLALTFVPQLGIAYQQAELEGDQVVSEGVHARFVPSIGIKSDLFFKWTNRFWLGLGGRVHEQLGGQRFVISRANEPPLEVLPLPALDFDVHLVVSYSF